MDDAPDRAQFRHFISIPVQWGDMDMLGHVNNVIFLRYIESGRIAYFNTLMDGDPDIWGGQGPILADIQCRFIKQLRYPAQLEVGTRTARIGRRSLILECAIFEAGAALPVSTSRAAVVWFNYGEQRAEPVPDALRHAIHDFEVSEPEE